jgi:NAD(P)H-hydrate epimerase
MAAGRAGAGVVCLAVPRAVIGAIAATVPEAVYVTIPDADSAAGASRTATAIGERLAKVTAVVVGPGLGDDETTGHLLEALLGAPPSKPRSIGFGAGPSASPDEPRPAPLASGERPLVVDADALNWLAGQANWWERLPAGKAVLTPHLGEMARLTGRSTEELAADPVGVAREAARVWGQVVVLKYGYTVATDGERSVVADDAPRSLASAGTGDVFAGTIGAFLAQGLAPLDAATLAIYVGTRAARRVERSVGVLGLVAGDLPRAIAEELAALAQGEGRR